MKIGLSYLVTLALYMTIYSSGSQPVVH